MTKNTYRNSKTRPRVSHVSKKSPTEAPVSRVSVSPSGTSGEKPANGFSPRAASASSTRLFRMYVLRPPTYVPHRQADFEKGHSSFNAQSLGQKSPVSRKAHLSQTQRHNSGPPRVRRVALGERLHQSHLALVLGARARPRLEEVRLTERQPATRRGITRPPAPPPTPAALEYPRAVPRLTQESTHRDAGARSSPASAFSASLNSPAFAAPTTASRLAGASAASSDYILVLQI